MILSRTCRTLKNNVKNGVKFSSTKPYEDIPGPPGKGLPFIGHLHMIYKKPNGFGKSWNNLKDLREKYLKDGDKLMRFHSKNFNPKNGRLVVLLDPKDVEVIYRNEGKYPSR